MTKSLDRIKAICQCMEELEQARSLELKSDYPFGRELWELDTLEELHRLLYEDT